MFGDECAQEFLALRVVEIDDMDAALAEPVDAALEGLGFAHDDGANTELAYEAAAVPARSERCRHDRVAIGALPSRFTKGVGLPVGRRIILLNTPIVTAAQEISFPVEESRSDRNAALAEALTGFFDRYLEKAGWVYLFFHLYEQFHAKARRKQRQ